MKSLISLTYLIRNFSAVSHLYLNLINNVDWIVHICTLHADRTGLVVRVRYTWHSKQKMLISRLMRLRCNDQQTILHTSNRNIHKSYVYVHYIPTFMEILGNYGFKVKLSILREIIVLRCLNV